VKAPEFISRPKSQTVDLTQVTTFECEATGYNVTYKWRCRSRSFPSKATGRNTNTLVIPDVRSSDDTIYTCTVSNKGGSVTSNPAKLTVTGMTNKYCMLACCDDTNFGIQVYQR